MKYRDLYFCHSERSEESIDRLIACKLADRFFVPQNDKSIKQKRSVKLLFCFIDYC